MENTSHTQTNFPVVHFYVNEGQIQKSYDKGTPAVFNVVRFLYKSSTIPSKMSFATISVEISMEQLPLWSTS